MTTVEMWDKVFLMGLEKQMPQSKDALNLWDFDLEDIEKMVANAIQIATVATRQRTRSIKEHNETKKKEEKPQDSTK